MQARFRILGIPSRVWNTKKMDSIITTCIILHNVIVEDDGYNISVGVPVPCPANNVPDEAETGVQLVLEHNETNIGFIARCLVEIEDENEHHLLRRDLIEHFWGWAGDQTE